MASSLLWSICEIERSLLDLRRSRRAGRGRSGRDHGAVGVEPRDGARRTRSAARTRTDVMTKLPSRLVARPILEPDQRLDVARRAGADRVVRAGRSCRPASDERRMATSAAEALRHRIASRRWYGRASRYARSRRGTLRSRRCRTCSWSLVSVARRRRRVPASRCRADARRAGRGAGSTAGRGPAEPRRPPGAPGRPGTRTSQVAITRARRWRDRAPGARRRSSCSSCIAAAALAFAPLRARPPDQPDDRGRSSTVDHRRPRPGTAAGVRRLRTSWNELR